MLYEAHLREAAMPRSKWPTLKELNCVFVLFHVLCCCVWACCLLTLSLNIYILGVKGWEKNIQSNGT